MGESPTVTLGMVELGEHVFLKMRTDLKSLDDAGQRGWLRHLPLQLPGRSDNLDVVPGWIQVIRLYQPLVRVFAGWDFEEAEVLRPDFAKQGYARGVPMGGDLAEPPAGEAPKFIVRALRDPDGANLDRIQIIKGWLDAAGELHEQIYDLACSDERALDQQHRCAQPVGDTVDVADAFYTNAIGDALLGAYWVDPDFDPAQPAFYYVRVIEIPTPRWTAFDARFFNILMPEGTEMKLQERAYTSPIWYTPAG